MAETLNPPKQVTCGNTSRSLRGWMVVGARPCLLLTYLLVAVPGARADLLWDNNVIPDPGGAARAISPPAFPAIRVAEDIVVRAPGWVIDGYQYGGIEDANWRSSGISEIFVYADGGGRPGVLIQSLTAPHARIPSGFRYFGRKHYYYRVAGIEIPLDQGTYWVGFRDPFGSGSGTNYWSSSDGGPDGGCPPKYPDGTCLRAQFSVDGGTTWGSDLYSRGFEVYGRAVPEPSALHALATLLGCAWLRRRSGPRHSRHLGSCQPRSEGLRQERSGG